MVAVQKPSRSVPEYDPLDTISRGLQIASQVYGIKDAMDKNELLKAQSLASKQKYEDDKKQTEFSNKADLSGKGLMVDPTTGNIVDDKNSSFYKSRMAEALKKGKDSKEGKQLPASEAVSLGGANLAFKALEDAGKSFSANEDITGPFQGRFEGLKAFVAPDSESSSRFKSLQAQLKANAQIIGKYLEGGKLTDSDIERYKDMLPNGTDKPEVANNKKIILQNLIAEKQAQERSALSAAGYNVGGISMPAIQKNPIQGDKQASDELSRAIQEKIRRQGMGASIPKKGR